MWPPISAPTVWPWQVSWSKFSFHICKMKTLDQILSSPERLSTLFGHSPLAPVPPPPKVDPVSIWLEGSK